VHVVTSIGRIVSLVLVDDQAELLGELAPFRVESPWWPDVETVGAPRQIKSWNPSSLWRLATAVGSVWLKCTPPFYAHESALIQLLGP
jgi:hypothetical protein